jgi:L-fuculose-phosphate aldolase
MHCHDTRRQVVAYCRKLADSHLAAGVAGNVSCLDRETGLVAISPSAMDYRAMSPEDVALIDSDGKRVGPGRRPSSEWAMHLACYRQRDEVGAVVHTHSRAATTLAVLGQELPAVHYMIALNGSDRIPLAPYNRFGSEELANAAVLAMGEGWACLLANHGVLATGQGLESAWDLAEHIEFCAELYLRASSLGEPRILSTEQISEVIAQLGSYDRQH